MASSTLNSPTPPTAGQAIAEAQAAVDAGDLATAVRIAGRGHRAGVRHPLLLNLLAYDCEQRGDYAGALRHLREALELDPNDPQILHGVGLCLSRMERWNEAMVAWNAALTHRPDFPAVHFHIGMADELLGEDADAARHYQIAARDPAYADPLGGLAAVAMRAGLRPQARDHARRALAINPGHPAATLALAGVELAEDDPVGAETRLAALLQSSLNARDRTAATLILADALDARNETDRAFAAYTEGKRLAREMYESSGGGAAAAAQRDLVARLSKWISTGPRWSAAPPDPVTPARGHVFLVGFPRSGTTLLEQVLASHTEVVTLEERPVLDPAADRYFTSADAIARLASLSGPELARERQAYWEALKTRGLDVSGKVLVDKFPLNTIKLPLIARLFPDAVILFAERDPRDVVLSAFRRNFRMNPAMAQFTDLESTARFYDAVMSLARIYLEKLPQTVVTVRHERLVSAFEDEVRRICQAVGLEWQPGLADFAARARERSIRTPSAQQVRRGLYSDALGQWRRYARHLSPVRPILNLWVERLGYDLDPQEEGR